MKLYTEEQVMKIAIQVKNFGYYDSSITPIELPSDEDIENAAVHLEPSVTRRAFQSGAKCMRDKITMTQQTDHVPDKKVTAVEWLIEKINHKSWENIMIDIPKDIIEQAKAMEKKQIIEAWRNGDNDSMYPPEQLDEQAEQYYNETYNK